MLLQEENWLTGYQQLMADCRPSSSSFSSIPTATTSSGTVLILCNPDADALCAARILRCILRADNIPFQLRPCGGMRKLVSILESLNLYVEDDSTGSSGNDDMHGDYDDDDGYNDDYGGAYNDEFRGNNNGGLNSNSSIRVVVLLNLGATKNLNKTLYSPRPILPNTSNPNNNPGNNVDPSNENSNDNNDDYNDDDGNNVVQFKSPLISRHIKTFVLDSHRPYHLANIHAGKNIVLWNDYDDWHENDGGIPSDGEGLSGDDEDDDDGDDDEDSDEDEDSDDSEEGEDSDEGEAEFEDEDDMKANRENLPEDDMEEEEIDPSSSLKRSSSSSSSSPSPNHENDIDNDSQSSPVPNKRQRQDGPETPDTEVMTDDGNDRSQETYDESPSQENFNNANTNTTIISMRERYEKRRNHIRNYYNNGSFYSSPVSFMTYVLSTKLRHSSVGDLLWLACVGVTDAYIHNRLDLSGYIRLSMDLQDRIGNMYADTDYIYRNGGGEYNNTAYNTNLIHQQVQNTFHAEELYSNSQNDPYGTGDNGSVIDTNYNGPMTKVGFSDNGKIIVQKDEFRFFLLRHVSLWDAMVLSSEVNTKMELWKSSGIKKLQEMLAKMGVPLTQCQQPYAFMKPMLKRRLKMVIEEHAEEYGLDNMKYTAFLRVTGYKSLLSASDVAYAVTALLECDTNESVVATLNQNNPQHQLNAEDEDERKLVSSFNTAYDALNPNANASLSGLSSSGLGEGSDLTSLVNGGEVGAGMKGISGGIRLAVSLQSAIVNAAMSLVERKEIIRLSHFRYAYLHATSHGANRGSRFNNSGARKSRTSDRSYNQHIFAKPLALTKLAIFIMDMHRTNKKWTGTKARPLLLLAEKPQTQTYLVVGFEFPEERGSVKRNQFKEKFKMVTETMQGTFKYDSFDSNVVEVSCNDVQKFIEHLHYMIDAIE